VQEEVREGEAGREAWQREAGNEYRGRYGVTERVHVRARCAARVATAAPSAQRAAYYAAVGFCL